MVKYSALRPTNSATPTPRRDDRGPSATSLVAGGVGATAVAVTRSPPDTAATHHEHRGDADHGGHAQRHTEPGPPLPAVTGVLVHQPAALPHGQVDRLGRRAGRDDVPGQRRPP